MENKFGWLIVVAWVAGILYIMSALAEGQVLNSDPYFMREGPKAYKCKTPKGRNVKCNKWLTVAKRGWKKSCTQPGETVLKGLSDPFDAQIMLGEDEPERQCTMLFDDAWSDYHRVNIKNKKKLEKELARELRPAEFHQFVEVKEEGEHEMSTCVVRDVDLILDPEYMPMANQGGITVSLIEWHTGSGPGGDPTWHMILPENKATFGWYGTLDGAKHFDLIVDIPEHVPPFGVMNPGQIVGVPPHGQPGASAYVYNRVGIQAIYDGWDRHFYYADGFNGHAGLENKYQGGVDAEWSCYSAVRYLLPGFYVLSAEILPSWVGGPEDADGNDIIDNDITEYFGFGAIKNIELRKVE